MYVNLVYAAILDSDERGLLSKFANRIVTKLDELASQDTFAAKLLRIASFGKLGKKKDQFKSVEEKIAKETEKIDKQLGALKVRIDKEKRNLISKLLLKFALFLVSTIRKISIVQTLYFAKLDELRQYMEQRKQKEQNKVQKESIEIGNFDLVIQDKGQGDAQIPFIAKTIAAVTMKAPPIGAFLVILLTLGQLVAAGIAWAIFKAFKFEAGLKLVDFKVIFESLKNVLLSFGTALVRLWPAVVKTFDDIKARFEKIQNTSKDSEEPEIINDVLGLFRKAVNFVLGLVKKVFSAKGLFIAAFSFVIVLLFVNAVGYDKLEAFLQNK